MSKFEDSDLNHFLIRRQTIINTLSQLFNQTKEVANKLGYGQNDGTDFDTQIERLHSDVIRIAIVGEFSRGKSHLVNALLRKEVLIHAKQQTTAVNTFIQGTSEEPYIEIVFWDEQKTPQRLPFETNALLKWTTELEDSNRENRKDVKIVNVYSDHPLFQNNFILVDTPGFEGIVEGHEKIARRAIENAHIAIWCQSTDQLGGNRHEWKFLEQTITRNFERFVTVVNKWDHIFNRNNLQDQKKTDAQLHTEALSHIRSNFISKLEGMELHGF